MLSSINGNLKGFSHEEGYLRTSCSKYSLKNLSNRLVHLTNDSVQKRSEDYGKYETGNKLDYMEFQAYLDKTCPAKNVCFERDILPQMKKITADCFRAVWGKIDPLKRCNMFELYGLDFMLDEDFKVYLIEVNTNPDLEVKESPILARLIPTVLDNTFQLAVDPLFPPPPGHTQSTKKSVSYELCPENKFELVFDERVDGPGLAEVIRKRGNVIVEIDDEDASSSESD
jgi:tubulin monoglycylase TTLL3/8